MWLRHERGVTFPSTNSEAVHEVMARKEVTIPRPLLFIAATAMHASQFHSCEVSSGIEAATGLRFSTPEEVMTAGRATLSLIDAVVGFGDWDKVKTHHSQKESVVHTTHTLQVPPAAGKSYAWSLLGDKTSSIDTLTVKYDATYGRGGELEEPAYTLQMAASIAGDEEWAGYNMNVSADPEIEGVGRELRLMSGYRNHDGTFGLRGDMSTDFNDLEQWAEVLAERPMGNIANLRIA